MYFSFFLCTLIFLTYTVSNITYKIKINKLLFIVKQLFYFSQKHSCAKEELTLIKLNFNILSEEKNTSIHVLKNEILKLVDFFIKYINNFTKLKV